MGIFYGKGSNRKYEKLNRIKKSTDKEETFQWMEEYLEYTTYEIAVPSLRNEALAPEGKTGLVISLLTDYDFIQNIHAVGLYEEFKNFAEQKMISVLNESIYETIQEKVIHRFSSSPLTIERLSGNLDGGITGWAFTNKVIPSITKLTKVKKSCETPIPAVWQAGQWTYSPSGLPISVLTGKIAADRVDKVLNKGKRK